MAKNLISDLILAYLAQKKFWWVLYQQDIAARYNCVQFQEKLMNKTWENGKKSIFGTDFGLFGPNLGPKIFFSWILLQVYVRHCWKLSFYAISRKNNESKWENHRKPSVWPNFGLFWLKFGPKFFLWISSLLDFMHCCRP